MINPIAQRVIRELPLPFPEILAPLCKTAARLLDIASADEHILAEFALKWGSCEAINFLYIESVIQIPIRIHRHSPPACIVPHFWYKCKLFDIKKTRKSV
jgi:hypothetical protein